MNSEVKKFVSIWLSNGCLAQVEADNIEYTTECIILTKKHVIVGLFRWESISHIFTNWEVK